MSNPSDKVYTPHHIAKEVLDIFLPMVGDGSVIEPFRGDGAFYDLLPDGCAWCEIDRGVDFMLHQEEYDWMITNPPYSEFKNMLPKILTTAKNVVLVIPMNKLLSSMPRMMDIQRAGANIKRIHYLGSGRQLKFPFGFPVGAVHILRGYAGPIEVTYAERCQHAKAK